MKFASTKIFYLIIFIVLVFFDQLSKYLIRSSGGFYICNKGIAFGIKLPEKLILIFSFALILFLGGLILNYKFKILNEIKNLKLKNLCLLENLKFKIENSKTSSWGLVLIISGGLSNTLDRLQHGCVIDFIDLKFWPLFNLADTFIVIGAIMIISHNLKCVSRIEK
jgi:lipoprotein signal peptidase